ncbi:polysaccharide pyruvyl transferase family protein [Neorhizobium lilium]|uniref:Polysaccharide pyruvyl transferase family protein n=1 Tax=Neorhizobium lilium TaxID=2503024 RepID=A0A444LIA6_9HYPH|nr:polysaccharide pyruvyl transferase family protein [Neorhizobium lilium]RWX78763.1 polysaccharide pyruvyl transferase family protein [Neorhizobium lilium]
MASKLKHRTIRFLGWYGHANCGDECFKEAHKSLFEDSDDTHFDLIWDNERGKYSKQDEVVVLGAGDVIKPFYVERLAPSTKIIIYGAGLSSTSDVEYMESIKKRIIGTWLRNKTDVEALRDRGIEAQYTPDIVFQLGNENMPVKSVKNRAKKVAACFFSNNSTQYSLYGRDLLLFNDELNRKIKLAKVLDLLSPWYDFNFYPLSQDLNDYDMSYCCDIYTLMHNRSSVTIKKPLKVFKEAIKATSEADLVLTMKFHGLIFACLAGTPFVNIATTRKNALFCQENSFADASVAEDNFSEASVMAAVKVAEYPPFSDRVSQARLRLINEAKVQAQAFRTFIMK